MAMAKDWLSSFQSLFVLEESWPLCTDAELGLPPRELEDSFFPSGHQNKGQVT